MNHRSDEELMLRFQRGDESAFRELFERYKTPVYGYVRRRIADLNRAEDVTQEVFIGLVRNRRRYRRRASFRTYLYRIAHNRIVSEYRASKDDQPLDEIAASTAAGNPERGNQVRDALWKIDPDHREVVMLREYEGLSYEEISRVLKIPVGTVRSRLYRGKMALCELLSPQARGGVEQ